VANETAKFITGDKNIETELDVYYQNLLKLGFEEYLQFYVDAYASFQASLD
jgi:hypothetical protein